MRKEVSFTKENRFKPEVMALLSTAFKGRNFMTPTVVGYAISGGYVVELSRGKGIWTDIIYGCTVAKNGQKQDDLSICVDTIKEAEEYVAGLN